MGQVPLQGSLALDLHAAIDGDTTDAHRRWHRRGHRRAAAGQRTGRRRWPAQPCRDAARQRPEPVAPEVHGPRRDVGGERAGGGEPGRSGVVAGGERSRCRRTALGRRAQGHRQDHRHDRRFQHDGRHWRQRGGARHVVRRAHHAHRGERVAGTSQRPDHREWRTARRAARTRGGAAAGGRRAGDRHRARDLEEPRGGRGAATADGDDGPDRQPACGHDPARRPYAVGRPADRRQYAGHACGVRRRGPGCQDRRRGGAVRRIWRNVARNRTRFRRSDGCESHRRFARPSGRAGAAQCRRQGRCHRPDRERGNPAGRLATAIAAAARAGADRLLRRRHDRQAAARTAPGGARGIRAGRRDARSDRVAAQSAGRPRWRGRYRDVRMHGSPAHRPGRPARYALPRRI